MPTGKRIKQVPASRKPRAEIAKRQRRVELVQREISGREALLPQFAAKDIDRIIAPGRGLRKSQMRHQDRSCFANVSGRYPCVGQSHLAQRVLLQRDGYRLLKSEGRRLGRGLRRRGQQQCHEGQDAPSESVASSQLSTPTARAGFIHAVLSSTISYVVWKLAVFCTIAPTEQYFSSERRMASSMTAGSISYPVTT